MKVFRNILLDNHYNTTDQRLKTPQNSVRGNTTPQKNPFQTETKMKQQTRNKMNKNSVANDETNYAVNKKVSEEFNKISTNTQPVTGVPF